MERVLILGRGGAGKSTLAMRLAEITGLTTVELDKLFWQPGLVAMPRDQWIEVQKRLVEQERWIMAGDLGPYDAVEVRLRAADTIILLDFSLLRCAWRSYRRSHERADYWLWILKYRLQSLPILMEAIAKQAPTADVHILRNPRAIKQFVDEVARKGQSPK